MVLFFCSGLTLNQSFCVFLGSGKPEPSLWLWCLFLMFQVGPKRNLLPEAPNLRAFASQGHILQSKTYNPNPQVGLEV